MEKKIVASLLTQYERYGALTREDYIEYFKDEELDIEIDMMGDYNEYLLNNRYNDDYIYPMDEIDDYLSNLTPSEIIDAVGRDFTLCDDYFIDTPYGLKSMGEDYVLDIIRNDDAFIEYLIEYKDLIDWDEADEQIEEANKLIKMGY